MNTFRDVSRSSLAAPERQVDFPRSQFVVGLVAYLACCLVGWTALPPSEMRLIYPILVLANFPLFSSLWAMVKAFLSWLEALTGGNVPPASIDHAKGRNSPADPPPLNGSEAAEAGLLDTLDTEAVGRPGRDATSGAVVFPYWLRGGRKENSPRLWAREETRP